MLLKKIFYLIVFLGVSVLFGEAEEATKNKTTETPETQVAKAALEPNQHQEKAPHKEAEAHEVATNQKVEDSKEEKKSEAKKEALVKKDSTVSRNEVEAKQEATENLGAVNEEIARQVQLDVIRISSEPKNQQGLMLIEMGQKQDCLEKKGREKAEQYYLEALKYELTDRERKNLMHELVLLFEQDQEYAKISLIYEKYLEMYPHDKSVPQILVKLGRIYRKMGAYDSALEKFYNVIDMSLSINENQMPLYEYLSTKAQLEIADTYFIMGEYKKVLKLFARMERTSLTYEERERIAYKTAYSQSKTKNYDEAIKSSTTFLKNYPKSKFAPEVWFLLVNAYKQTNEYQNAIEAVFSMLSFKSYDKKDEPTWIYWQRKTANELANSFYEQGDFINALKVYQAMAKLSNTRDWQWPVIYQIGRCFEKLKIYDKAKESYNIIVTDKEWKNKDLNLSDNLKTIKERAQWRYNNLVWFKKSETELDAILEPRKRESIESA